MWLNALSRLAPKMLTAANTITAITPAITAYSMATTARRSTVNANQAFKYSIMAESLCVLRRLRSGWDKIIDAVPKSSWVARIETKWASRTIDQMD